MPIKHKSGPSKPVLPAKTAGLVTIKTDYASFPSDGRGRVRVPDGVKLRKGQRVAVTDDDADTVEAEVLAEPSNGRAEVRLNWTKVLHFAD